MTNYDIVQKLILLPKELEDKNVQSWNHIVSMCQLYFSHGGKIRWRILSDLIQELSKAGQTKLFRGGLSLFTMMISTKEETGLGKEDAYLCVHVGDGDIAEVGYFAIDTQEAETFECKNNELFIKIQPLLDRLWDETRGKKNAS